MKTTYRQLNLDNCFGISHLLKRFFDIVFSLLALIVLSPVFLIIALLIKKSSPGPAFYSSIRIGKNWKPIRCWKFRTMYVDADHQLQKVLSSDSALRKEWETYRKLKNDPRIIPIGQFLRKTSLDELPQFWNVLLGDLSVVGPRPVTLEEIKTYYGNKAEKILSIRPGITGIWQTSGRNLKTYKQRVRMEEHYVDKRSFFMDLFLVAKTVFVMIKPKGAF